MADRPKWQVILSTRQRFITQHSNIMDTQPPPTPPSDSAVISPSTSHKPDNSLPKVNSSRKSKKTKLSKAEPRSGTRTSPQVVADSKSKEHSCQSFFFSSSRSIFSLSILSPLISFFSRSFLKHFSPLRPTAALSTRPFFPLHSSPSALSGSKRSNIPRYEPFLSR